MVTLYQNKEYYNCSKPVLRIFFLLHFYLFPVWLHSTFFKNNLISRSSIFCQIVHLKSEIVHLLSYCNCELKIKKKQAVGQNIIISYSFLLTKDAVI